MDASLFLGFLLSRSKRGRESRSCAVSLRAHLRVTRRRSQTGSSGLRDQEREGGCSFFIFQYFICS